MLTSTILKFRIVQIEGTRQVRCLANAKAGRQGGLYDSR